MESMIRSVLPKQVSNDYIEYLKEKVQKHTQRKKLSNEDLKVVLKEIIEENEKKVNQLVAEYNSNKGGLNKYEKDGIWMDIGGLTSESKMIEEALTRIA